MKQLKSWFFSSIRGLNPRGKFINLADFGEPDQVTFTDLLDTTLTKKIDLANYQDQADHNDVNFRINGDKFIIPAHLPELVTPLGSKFVITPSTPTLLTPRVVYTLDAPVADDSAVSIRDANKYATAANLPVIAPSGDIGNTLVVTPVVAGGFTTYEVFAPSGSFIAGKGINITSGVVSVDFQFGNFSGANASTNGIYIEDTHYSGIYIISTIGGIQLQCQQTFAINSNSDLQLTAASGNLDINSNNGTVDINAPNGQFQVNVKGQIEINANDPSSGWIDVEVQAGVFLYSSGGAVGISIEDVGIVIENDVGPVQINSFGGGGISMESDAGLAIFLDGSTFSLVDATTYSIECNGNFDVQANGGHIILTTYGLIKFDANDLTLSFTGSGIIADNGFGKGIQYNDDYSPNYVVRSLVDQGYVLTFLSNYTTPLNVDVNLSDPGSYINFMSDGGGAYFLDTTSGLSIDIGQVVLEDTYTNGLLLRSATRVKIDQRMNLKPITTTQRDALTPAQGDMICNSTLNKLQWYNGATWETITSV